MTKDEILNNVQKASLLEMKKGLSENSDPDKSNALAMLSNKLEFMKHGIFTTTTIRLEKQDCEFKLRLLGADEIHAAHIETELNQQEDGVFTQFNADYHYVIAILHRACSPNPFKVETAEWTREDLKKIPLGMLQELCKDYMDFVDMTTTEIKSLPPLELEQFVDVLKKKPELLRDLSRSKLLPIASWLLEYYVTTQNTVNNVMKS